MPETIDILGEKTWIDNENQDGIRPERISINLYANGILVARAHVSAASGWAWSFANLRKYDNNGQEIIYTIDEEAVEGYTTIISGYDVVNVYTPTSTTVDVVKIWDDMNDLDGSRPASVTVTLMANGRAVLTEVLSDANNWSASVSDLPMNENGAAIDYVWTETPVDGYTLSTSVLGNITVLTNTHMPELTQVTVRKVWDDSSNALGIRPQRILASLSNGMKVVLNAANGWTATVTGLPVTVRGEKIVYTWTEQDVPGYVQTDVSVSGDVTTFTNAVWQRPVPPPNVPITPHRPGVPVLIIEEYNTPLAFNVDINHVGYCFD